MSTELSTGARVGAYAAGLAVVLGAAFGVGRLVGPLETEPEPAEHGHTDGASADGATEESHAGHGEPAATDVTGLTASADGYTLELAEPRLRAGRRELAFTIRTSGGSPLTDYTEAHEKDLHLILVRRDTTGYQHLHPVLDPATGRWSTTADLTGGTWRVIADFVPTGWEPLTLADDLQVAGRFDPAPLPAPSMTATVGDYEVHLSGSVAPGADTTLTAHVERDGEPVTDLEPYLGAYGHLVALRTGDLGYLHVHPEDGAAGPEIQFHTQFPTHGTYRLFLDFAHAGEVRTAEFTVDAGGVPGSSSEGGEHEH